jgi:hypothetical protein
VRLQVTTSQRISRALVVALILAATPLPTIAGEPPAPTAPRPSLNALVQQAAAVTPIAPARAQTVVGSGKTDFGSPSFFKKPAGILVLATIAAGVGYALYSTQNDRVSSPGRK